MDVKRQARRAVRRGLLRLGFDVRPVGKIKIDMDIPDASLYRPLFEPWKADSWRHRLHTDDSVSLVSADRRYVLWQTLSQALRTTPGSVFECGVYRGGTARIFAELMVESAPDRTLHLFDTFAGMPEVHPEFDKHRPGDFDDVSLDAVKHYLADFENVMYHPGLIPQAFEEVDVADICFAHIDLDIYQAILDATAFVYARIPRGGFIVFDDYGFPSCPGARRAVDEFFAQRAEVPIVLTTGQCLVVKA